VRTAAAAAAQGHSAAADFIAGGAMSLEDHFRGCIWLTIDAITTQSGQHKKRRELYWVQAMGGHCLTACIRNVRYCLSMEGATPKRL